MQKREYFDKDACDVILKQPNTVFTKTEKDKLLRMRKLLVDGNILPVTYNYSSSLSHLQFGRVYQELSIGQLEASVRSVMLHKHYWDIDMENCHYNIALELCKRYSLPHENIKKYCEKREEVLKDLMEKFEINRITAKTLMLKIAYGGSYCPPGLSPKDEIVFLHTNPAGADEFVFLKSLKYEMKGLSQYIYDLPECAEILKIRFPKDTNPLGKTGPQKIYKLMAHFLQDIERKLLFLINDIFEKQLNRSVDILMHDGLLIRKSNATESKESVTDLFKTIEEQVQEKLNYKINLVIKEMPVCTLSAEESDEDVQLFWENHIKVGDKVYQCNVAGEDLPMQRSREYFYNYADTFSCLGDKVYKIVLTDAIKQKRYYDKMEFIPFGDKVHPMIYNTFKGLNWTSYFDSTIQNSDDFQLLVSRLTSSSEYGLTEEESTKFKNTMMYKQITEILCNNDKDYIDYFINFLAHCIFNPSKRIQKIPCLRNNVGGSGKTAFMELVFGEKLIGKKYFFKTSTVSDIFGQANGSVRNCLFVLLEEMEVSKTKEFTSVIKSTATADYIRVRALYENARNQKNYINFMANTNKEVAFEFDPKNYRRFPQIDCKEYRLTEEEVAKLVKEKDDDDIIKLLVKWLAKMYRPDFNFDKFKDSGSIIRCKSIFTEPFDIFIQFLVWELQGNERYSHLGASFAPFMEVMGKEQPLRLKAEILPYDFYMAYKSIITEIQNPKFGDITQNRFMNDQAFKNFQEKFTALNGFQKFTKYEKSRVSYIFDVNILRQYIEPIEKVDPNYEEPESSSGQKRTLPQHVDSFPPAKK
jgi:hypothetical protein